MSVAQPFCFLKYVQIFMSIRKFMFVFWHKLLIKLSSKNILSVQRILLHELNHEVITQYLESIFAVYTPIY